MSITKLLTSICNDKKIKFDENSLALIAEKSDGSIRDSLSMFDRLVSFTDSNLTIADVTSNLNVLDYDTYFDLSSLIKNKDIPGILTKYNDVFSRGFDDVNFLNGLSRHLREMLVSKIGYSDKISNLNDELRAKYIDQSSNFKDEDLILMIQIINESLINYQKINDKRIHVELCLMRIASIDSIKKKNSLIKTSEIINLIKKETKELDNSSESINKKLFSSPQLEEVSSLS